MSAKPNSFFDFFSDPNPILRVKFDVYSDEKPLTVLVKNKSGSKISQNGKDYFKKLGLDEKLNDLSNFYCSHDGVELFVPYKPENCKPIPLIKFISSMHIEWFTAQYRPGGEWGWIIDLNKSKTLYREGSSWIAFAKIGEGPACLTTFLGGENAGKVYFATPQPHFNILKPIAKSFNLLLDRIAKDPAAFLRLVRGYVTVKKLDGQNYGFCSVEYAGDIVI